MKDEEDSDDEEEKLDEKVVNEIQAMKSMPMQLAKYAVQHADNTAIGDYIYNLLVEFPTDEIKQTIDDVDEKDPAAKRIVAVLRETQEEKPPKRTKEERDEEELADVEDYIEEIKRDAVELAKFASVHSKNPTIGHYIRELLIQLPRKDLEHAIRQVEDDYQNNVAQKHMVARLKSALAQVKLDSLPRQQLRRLLEKADAIADRRDHTQVNQFFAALASLERGRYVGQRTYTELIKILETCVDKLENLAIDYKRDDPEVTALLTDFDRKYKESEAPAPQRLAKIKTKTDALEASATKRRLLDDIKTLQGATVKNMDAYTDLVALLELSVSQVADENEDITDLLDDFDSEYKEYTKATQDELNEELQDLARLRKFEEWREYELQDGANPGFVIRVPQDTLVRQTYAGASHASMANDMLYTAMFTNRALSNWVISPTLMNLIVITVKELAFQPRKLKSYPEVFHYLPPSRPGVWRAHPNALTFLDKDTWARWQDEYVRFFNSDSKWASRRREMFWQSLWIASPYTSKPKDAFVSAWKTTWHDLIRTNLVGIVDRKENDDSKVKDEETKYLNAEAKHSYDDYVIDFCGPYITDGMREAFFAATLAEDKTAILTTAIRKAHQTIDTRRKFVAAIRSQQTKLIQETTKHETDILKMETEKTELMIKIAQMPEDVDEEEKQEALDFLRAITDEIELAKQIIPMTSATGRLQWHHVDLEQQEAISVQQDRLNVPTSKRPKLGDTTDESADPLTEIKPKDSKALIRMRKQLAVQIDFEKSHRNITVPEEAEEAELYYKQMADITQTIEEMKEEIEQKEAAEKRERKGKQKSSSDKLYDSVWDRYCDLAIDYKVHRQQFETRRFFVILIELIRRRFFPLERPIREAFDHRTPLPGRFFIVKPKETLIAQLKTLVPPVTFQQADETISRKLVITIEDADMVVPEAIDVVTYADLPYTGPRRMRDADPATAPLTVEEVAKKQRLAEERKRKRIPKIPQPPPAKSSSSAKAPVESSSSEKAPVRKLPSIIRKPPRKQSKYAEMKPEELKLVSRANVFRSSQKVFDSWLDAKGFNEQERAEMTKLRKDAQDKKREKSKVKRTDETKPKKKPVKPDTDAMKVDSAPMKPVQPDYEAMKPEELKLVSYGKMLTASQEIFDRWLDALQLTDERRAAMIKSREDAQAKKPVKRRVKRATETESTEETKPKPVKQRVKRAGKTKNVAMEVDSAPKKPLKPDYETMEPDELKRVSYGQIFRESQKIFEQWLDANKFNDERRAAMIKSREDAQIKKPAKRRVKSAVERKSTDETTAMETKSKSKPVKPDTDETTAMEVDSAPTKSKPAPKSKAQVTPRPKKARKTVNRKVSYKEESSSESSSSESSESSSSESEASSVEEVPKKKHRRKQV